MLRNTLLTIISIAMLTGCGNRSSVDAENSTEKTSEGEQCTVENKAYTTGYNNGGGSDRIYAEGMAQGFCRTECSVNIGNQHWKIDFQSCYDHCHTGAMDSYDQLKPRMKLCDK